MVCRRFLLFVTHIHSEAFLIFSMCVYLCVCVFMCVYFASCICVYSTLWLCLCIGLSCKQNSKNTQPSASTVTSRLGGKRSGQLYFCVFALAPFHWKHPHVYTHRHMHDNNPESNDAWVSNARVNQSIAPHIVTARTMKKTRTQQKYKNNNTKTNNNNIHTIAVYTPSAFIHLYWLDSIARQGLFLEWTVQCVPLISIGRSAEWLSKHSRLFV